MVFRWPTILSLLSKQKQFVWHNVQYADNGKCDYWITDFEIAKSPNKVYLCDTILQINYVPRWKYDIYGIC